MKQIPLTQGKFVLVDDEDYLYLNQWKWTYHSNGYAKINKKKLFRKPETILMHRMLMNPSSGMVVDHINGNKLDNRKENLRVCTYSENNRNKQHPLFHEVGVEVDPLYHRGGRNKAINRTEIPLTKGKVTYIAESDFDYLNQWTWYYISSGYAARSQGHLFGKKETILMHRALLNPPNGMFIDHVNGDKLDNRRENLRICTETESSRNTKSRSDSLSKYKGVSWDDRKKKWRTRINVNKKELWLGYFTSEEEAALAWNEAAIKYHGAFAKLNEIGA